MTSLDDSRIVATSESKACPALAFTYLVVLYLQHIFSECSMCFQIDKIEFLNLLMFYAFGCLFLS